MSNYLFIRGYDRRYESRKKSKIYGKFKKANEQMQCYKYLEWLKRSCLNDVITFYVEES